MATALRTFTDAPAVRKEVPLLLGIVGGSGSGKTYSALRLATGMQQVIGGDIFVIDTEHNRALNYADIFRFRHVPFAPPFGSLDYLRAIEYCYHKGGKIIVIDSMTHEHSGEGGYLWSAEQFLLDKINAEPENAKRYRREQKSEHQIRAGNSRTKWIQPASDRKALINGIVQMGINGIFCYRAQEKLDDDFKPLGWEPETTSRLIYEMQQQFLLLPGSDGVPKFNEATASEKRLIKTPAQFRDWFKQGQRLDEAMGKRMAEWAAGSKVSSSSPSNLVPTKDAGVEAGGAGRVESPASPAAKDSRLAQVEAGELNPPRQDGDRGGSSQAAPPPEKKPAGWQINFMQKMGELKKIDRSTYYEVLGREGYEHANLVTDRKAALLVYEAVRQAIADRQVNMPIVG